MEKIRFARCLLREEVLRFVRFTRFGLKEQTSPSLGRLFGSLRSFLEFFFFFFLFCLDCSFGEYIYIYILISKGNFIQELNNESPTYTGSKQPGTNIIKYINYKHPSNHRLKK